MPTVPELISKRRQRKNRLQHNHLDHLGLSSSMLLALLFALSAILIPLAYSSFSKDLPSLEKLPALLEPPDGLLREPTRVYDNREAVVLYTLENPAASGASYLPVEGKQGQILPTSLISATLAISDPGFWSHSGFSGSSWNMQEPTTLAQHLAVDLLLWEESPGLVRSLRERLLAAQMTARYGRSKILEWYLNSAYYGSLAYGADAASRVYFGKTAAQLSLAEAAVLAAASYNPQANPLDAPEDAFALQEQVIQAMVVYGYITIDQAVEARQQKLTFQPRQEAVPDSSSAFTNLILDQVSEYIPRSQLERGGFKIITTLDAKLQEQVACALSEQLRRMQAEVPAEMPSGGCPAARLLPTLLADQPEAIPDLEGSAIVMDPSNGNILALTVISPQSARQAVLAPHPAGTLLTPFIYLTGFTRGLTPASLVWDVPPSSGFSGETLPNIDGTYQGPLRARIALANDYWAPAVSVLEVAGVENTWRTVHQMGISSIGQVEDSSGLNPFIESQVTLLEIARAYSILANNGALTGQPVGPTSIPAGAPPLRSTMVQRVVDMDGRRWLDWGSIDSQPVIASQLAYLLTHVLSDEPARWPSLGHPNSLEVGRPAAAKIGRTLAGKDAWALGYTPQRVVGVWLGMPGDSEGQDLSPAAAAAWHALLQYATRDLPPQNWIQPAGVANQVVCDPSGMLPTSNCPAVVTEVFLSGTEPIFPDSLYRSVLINRATERLATIFTPQELVEERVYLFPPPEAAEWANSAGYENSPNIYDAVEIPPATPEVQISSPQMFAYVRGKVNILGSVAGEDLSFYRVQIGKGLYPQQWLQIGQDMSRPASKDKLAVWDTSELSGLYVIELRAVRSDQTVDRALILVTVDNQPPLVDILYPQAQETAVTHPNGTLTIQVEAQDDTQLGEVAIYIDEKLLITLYDAPYAFPWTAKTGEHTLRVVARDQAGNETETSLVFSISK